MSALFPILTTGLVSDALLLAKDTLALNCLGLIQGPNGTGKTEALRAVHTRFSSFSKDGSAYYHRACAVIGPTRGVKDLLSEIGLKAGHVSSLSLQLACKLALREFSSRNIRLILLDEADSLAKDSMGGLITLVDYCNANGHRLSLLMAAAQDLPHWFDIQKAGKSRTVRCIKASHLSLEESLAILSEWLPQLKDLIANGQAGDPQSLKLARLIYQGTGEGNLRRLSYFAGLLNTENTFDGPAIKSVIERIALGK